MHELLAIIVDNDIVDSLNLKITRDLDGNYDYDAIDKIESHAMSHIDKLMFKYSPYEIDPYPEYKLSNKEIQYFVLDMIERKLNTRLENGEKINVKKELKKLKRKVHFKNYFDIHFDEFKEEFGEYIMKHDGDFYETFDMNPEYKYDYYSLCNYEDGPIKKTNGEIVSFSKIKDISFNDINNKQYNREVELKEYQQLIRKRVYKKVYKNFLSYQLYYSYFKTQSVLLKNGQWIERNQKSDWVLNYEKLIKENSNPEDYLFIINYHI